MNMFRLLSRNVEDPQWRAAIFLKGPLIMFYRISISFCVLFLLVSLVSTAVAEDEWRPLFNGRDLEGWTAKIRFHEAGENFGNTFRVEDGILKVAYDEYEKFDDRFGHLFFDEEFSHYRLRVEYRIIGEQVPGGAGWAFKNSGLMLHGQSPQSMAIDQEFPVSIEVQLLGGNGEDDRPTCNLCTPGTHVVRDGRLFTRHCTNSTSPTFHGDEWVTAEVEVHGEKSIKHYINGELVLAYDEPQYDPKDGNAKPLIEQQGGQLLINHGTISLQSESHPVEFRKVDILVLEE
ncbi:MAG: 3-keto-disaccharide hydrolase [Aeoliella sp.]